MIDEYLEYLQKKSIIYIISMNDLQFIICVRNIKRTHLVRKKQINKQNEVEYKKQVHT